MLNFKHLNRVLTGHILDTLFIFSVNSTFLAMKKWTLKTSPSDEDSLIVALSVIYDSMLFIVM